MASLNNIVDRIAYDLKEPLNYSLKEALKLTVRTWRATLIRRDFERNGNSPTYLQNFTTKLIKVDKADTCIVETKCAKILRTEKIIPKPVRLNSDIDFKYVGVIGGGESFTYTEFEEVKFTKYNKYTPNVTRYAFRNGYLYIFGYQKHYKYLAIEAAFEDPSLVVDLCINSIDCFNDDDQEYPLPLDMAQIIIEGISKGQIEILKGKSVNEVVPIHADKE